MSFFKLSIRAILVLACASIFAVCASAQFKASIQGTVLDAKGGVVAGAKVTVTNQGTGIVYEAVASGVGYYRVSELPPGNYTVTVEATGFKRHVQSGVIVDVNAKLGLPAIALEVGAAGESVTVEANAVQLETVTAERSGVVTGKQIVDIAINGKLNSAELYASGDLFQRMWPKLLQASATEAVAESKAKRVKPPALSSVQELLAAADGGHLHDRVRSVRRQRLRAGGR